jgi:hypothetical protein
MNRLKLVKAFAKIIDNPGMLFYKNAGRDALQTVILT